MNSILLDRAAPAAQDGCRRAGGLAVQERMRIVAPDRAAPAAQESKAGEPGGSRSRSAA